MSSGTIKQEHSESGDNIARDKNIDCQCETEKKRLDCS